MKPNVLIGLSGCGGIFTDEVLTSMSEGCPVSSPNLKGIYFTIDHCVKTYFFIFRTNLQLFSHFPIQLLEQSVLQNKHKGVQEAEQFLLQAHHFLMLILMEWILPHLNAIIGMIFSEYYQFFRTLCADTVYQF